MVVWNHPTFRCIPFPRFVLVVAFRLGCQTPRLFAAIGSRVGIFYTCGKNFLRNNFWNSDIFHWRCHVHNHRPF